MKRTRVISTTFLQHKQISVNNMKKGPSLKMNDKIRNVFAMIKNLGRAHFIREEQRVNNTQCAS